MNWRNLEGWKKGAIVGFVWTIMGSTIVVNTYDKFDWDGQFSFLRIILVFPFGVANLLGFAYTSVYIGAPLVGIAIGALLGFLYDLRKEHRRTGKVELKLDYWQKGAGIGVVWSLVGFGADFIETAYRHDILALPDLVEILILILYFIATLPIGIASILHLGSIYFGGLLFGFLLGAVGGRIYGKRRGGVK
jgi:membrane associated rhomboid family serine protease